ncbi:MAG TPA: tRNA uridine-5-carboxymethylaminomethyl(34) synthesis GTPase MnmE [Vicinamibacterales bacterium]
MLRVDDTIVAIATPAGHGGIGVVRLSGAQAPEIASTLVGRPLDEPRRATLARVALGNGHETLHDQVVVTWFAAPHSYTGEHVVELSAHGSPVILRAIVERAAALGARLAEPGEFTMRAYLRGRMDLAQAEAVADLAAASTRLEARSASEQLHGSLSAAIRALHERLFELIARLEASLDFPEEGYHFITGDELGGAISALRADVLRLATAGRRGRLLREGAVVALAGRPNTGKSSLFNCLVGFNRAIVTATPGTTRDVLTETIDLAGVRTTLVDTAGVRETADPIEAEGVRRAIAAAESATLTVLVLDRSEVLTDEDRALLERTPEALIAANKSDLAPAWPLSDVQGAIEVSARTGSGMDALTGGIADRLGAASLSRELPVVTNMRHVLLLEEAGAALERAALAVGEQQMPEEFVLADLHEARHALERVVGAHDPDDLLNHIFSRFCIGK